MNTWPSHTTVVRHPTILTGGYLNSHVQQNRGTTVHIPEGNRLIFSRKINIIGPNLELVALIRAQQICFIMGPLDMQGLVGAATIIGSLKYGASFSGLDKQEDPVFFIRLKDDDLLEDDSAFLQSLRFSCARVDGVYPPLALVEAYITEEDRTSMRRLHLIVVDLHRRIIH